MIVDNAQQEIHPSWVVRNLMRPSTRLLNPISVRLAGGPGFRMAGRVHHIGRRTGATYVTPVGVRVKDGKALIPLTFGNQSDWVRNVRDAGGATIEVHGKTYAMGAPAFINWSDAPDLVRANFPVARWVFKILGIRQFMHAEVTDQ